MATDTDKMELSDALVVLIGCGRMGSALAGGLIDSGRLAPARLVCIDQDTAKAASLGAELGARTELPDTFEGPCVWILAVKPGDIGSAVDEYGEHIETDDFVVSIAAGVSIQKLRAVVGDEPHLVRAMPNTPALVRAGVTGFMADGEFDTTAVVDLFESVGQVVELEREEHFDGLTALSGSGPAYVFTAIEALADGAVLMGLSREVARTLAVETVAGAAALVKDDPTVHTAELKDRVASPGGTTIAGLSKLEEKGFRHALIGAVEAAAQRSRQMGEEE